MVDVLEAIASGPAAWALDGYFSRTLSTSGGTAPSFAGESFLSYFLTNESNYLSALKEIEGKKGAFVGVGQIMPFAYGQEASHAYVVDSDASIPYAFTPLFGALLTAARTRAEFLSLILARPIPKYDDRFHSRAISGTELLWAFKDLRVDYSMVGRIDELLSAQISRRVPGGIREKVRNAVLLSLDRLRLLFENGAPGTKLMNLAVTNSAGRGGLLSNEIEFGRQRALFAEGRMTGVAADLASETWKYISGMIGDDVGLVYLSNVEDWLFEEAIRTKDFGRLYPFFENLSLLPGAANATVVSALNLTGTEISPLAEYIERSIPLELSPLEAGAIAAQFVSVRFYIAGKQPVAKESPYAPYLFYQLGEPFGKGGGEVIETARKILDGKKMPSEEFDGMMSQESEPYRAAHPATKKLFIKNLVALRALYPQKKIGGIAKSLESGGKGADVHEKGAAILLGGDNSSPSGSCCDKAFAQGPTQLKLFTNAESQVPPKIR